MYAIEEILTLMVDFETAQRGYALSADKEFLSPALIADTKIFNKLNNLKKLVNHNSNQLKRID